MASAVNAIAAASSARCLTLTPSVSGSCKSRSFAAPLSLHCGRSTFCGRSLSSSLRSASARHYQQKRVSKHIVRALADVVENVTGDVADDVADNVDDEDEEEREPRPMVREWPDKQFIEEVLAAFPEKAIADVEEARVLYENGYTYVDVRPALELTEVGKVIGCVNVPLYNAKKVFDKEQNKKVVKKEKNNDFLKTFEKKFPDKKAKLLIACSDAKAYSMDALMQLDEAGYENLVALSGGYYAWYQVFDHKLGRRRYGEYQEDYRHGADSCGIHASGAGFEKMDGKERWVPPAF